MLCSVSCVSDMQALQTSLQDRGAHTHSALRRHGVQKNGIHYGDNDVPPYDLADSTRLAEAYRLVSAVAGGGRPMFNVKLTPVEETRMAFAVADDRHAELRKPRSMPVYVRQRINVASSVS
jgi:hypothetical protein